MVIINWLKRGQSFQANIKKRINKRLQNYGQDKGNASRHGDDDKYERISDKQKRLIEYKERIIEINESFFPTQGKKRGKGIRMYKQQKRNAYKVSVGQYGGLLINVPRLLNNMVVEARKGGNIVYENKADKSLIDLLTKKFNPKKIYTSLARQVFNDLNLLSGIPPHKSSGKTSLIGGAIYYSKPEDIMKRLTLVTGARAAGNTNVALRNEAWEIVDKLLQDSSITKQQYDKYVQRHLA